MKNILLKLDKLKISVSEVLPADQMTDAEIQLGGAYDGISIQIGGGYYYVGREMEDGSYRRQRKPPQRTHRSTQRKGNRVRCFNCHSPLPKTSRIKRVTCQTCGWRNEIKPPLVQVLGRGLREVNKIPTDQELIQHALKRISALEIEVGRLTSLTSKI